MGWRNLTNLWLVSGWLNASYCYETRPTTTTLSFECSMPFVEILRTDAMLYVDCLGFFITTDHSRNHPTLLLQTRCQTRCYKHVAVFLEPHWRFFYIRNVSAIAYSFVGNLSKS